ncbi:hypothetical protein BH09BAC1_BH09BAC1_09160 [soil metagenome]
MSYKVDSTSGFKRLLKKLLKKFPSLKEDVSMLIDSLMENPKQGTPLGKDCFKIRLAITSKGKGKSGGARVITYVLVKDETVYLLSIYDKSEQDSISETELARLIEDI